MQNKFLESIRIGFINQINEIINETKKEAEEKNLNAIDTLALINNRINSWIESINGMFHIDDELINKVAVLKKPFVVSAKKEIIEEISKIIESENGDVVSKINSFILEVNRKGINLDGNNQIKTSSKKTKSEPIKTPSFPSYDLGYTQESSKKHVLKKERDDSDCSSDNCGSSSLCGGGSTGSSCCDSGNSSCGGSSSCC